MKQSRMSAGCAVAQGAIFMVGGHNTEHFMDTCESWDPRAPKWRMVRLLATMSPRALRCSSAQPAICILGCAMAQGAIFMVSGHNTEHFMDTCESWDPRAPKWRMVRLLAKMSPCNALAIMSLCNALSLLHVMPYASCRASQSQVLERLALFGSCNRSRPPLTSAACGQVGPAMQTVRSGPTVAASADGRSLTGGLSVPYAACSSSLIIKPVPW